MSPVTPAIASQTLLDQQLHAARQQAFPQPPTPPEAGAAPSSELREAFTDFVGQTFYGQLLAAMRQTVGKPAYFHGGRSEEVFQGQLDQMLSERLAHSTSNALVDPMFDLFTMHQPG